MKKLLVGLCAVLLGASLMLEPAYAKRLGGGGSMGAQRSLSSGSPAAAPARPAQQAQQAAPAPAKPAVPQSAGSRWSGILGGLALGGLLGWMLGSSGMAGPIMSMMLFALLAFAAFVVFRMIMAKRNPVPQQMQYAGLGNETVAAPPPSQLAGFDAQPASQPSASATPANIPAAFDVAGFVRQAKINYIKLQAINDSGKSEELHEYTTPEMFASLRGGSAQTAGQHTDVVTLNADLLEVVTEGDKHWASVRFSGLVREEPGQAPTPFEEIWNLSKPLDGSSGWLLAGIQQMH